VKEAIYVNESKNEIFFLFRKATHVSDIKRVCLIAKNYFGFSTHVWFETFGMQSWNEQIEKYKISDEQIVGRNVS
jgi:hypothetical protein